MPRPAGRWHGPAVFLAALAIFVTAPNVTNSDAYLSVPTAVSLVHEGDLDLDEFFSPVVSGHYGYIAVGDRHYDGFPWTVSLLAVPVVLAVDLAAVAGFGDGAVTLVESNAMGRMQLIAASLVSALAVMLVYVLAFERLAALTGWPPARRRRVALGVATVFALGTPAWSTTSRALWQHGPSMLMLAMVALCASRLASSREGPGRATAAVLGAALAGAYAFRPTNAIAVVAFTGWIVVTRRRLAPALMLGALAVAVPWLAVNVGVFGNLLPPYYSASRLSLHDEYLEAVVANMISPARGLLTFSPVVLLSVAGVVVQRRRGAWSSLDLVMAGCVVVHLLAVSAQNEGWWAGHAFGPRFMSDVLPFLVFLALPAVAALAEAGVDRPARIARILTAAAVVVSVLVHAQGAYLRATLCWNGRPADIDSTSNRVWDLRRPQVLSGYQALAGDEPLGQVVLGPCPPPA